MKFYFLYENLSFSCFVLLFGCKKIEQLLLTAIKNAAPTKFCAAFFVRSIEPQTLRGMTSGRTGEAIPDYGLFIGDEALIVELHGVVDVQAASGSHFAVKGVDLVGAFQQAGLDLVVAHGGIHG